MPKVTYIEASGKKHEIQVDTGLSIMEGAVQNSVPGIDADCGGSLSSRSDLISPYGDVQVSATL